MPMRAETQRSSASFRSTAGPRASAARQAVTADMWSYRNVLAMYFVLEVVYMQVVYVRLTCVLYVYMLSRFIN